MNYQDLNPSMEAAWINPLYLPFEYTDALCQLIVSDEDILDAEKRLQRFAPFLMKKFPETAKNNGLIESELVEISNMKQSLISKYELDIDSRLMLKKDSHLDIAGSVKARGGIYEVLKHAEALALEHGMISISESYEKFATKEMRDFFSQYTIQVGSTGNLGMSIGIISEALGFNVTIHMSSDAKQWKKDLLRKRGVNVIEYKDDYSHAVMEGRKSSLSDEKSYFVDDERSKDLFIGYAVAASRLARQLEEKSIKVDEEHPLIVFLPAGVGGAPGGISYGLKRIFKNNVHCFFAEPQNCPSILLGMASGKFENAAVQDYGFSGATAADGLACASPSSFVTRIMTNLVSGILTVSDCRLYDFLRMLNESEGIRIEPSACAGFIGVNQLCQNKEIKQYLKDQGIDGKLDNASVIVWATGGRLVPDYAMDEYLAF